jgi:hypothetical protein
LRHAAGHLCDFLNRRRAWEPAYVGSQKYLIPDLILERAAGARAGTAIFQTKYARHYVQAELALGLR